MAKEESPDTAIGELGDETFQTAKQALTLCWSIDFLFCSWTEAIEKAESLAPHPGSLYEVCREFEVKHLRETIDRFWLHLSAVQELLTEKRQSRQIQRLYQTPQRFAENEYPSFCDGVLSLAQRLCGGLCLAVHGLTLDLEDEQDPSEFVLQADPLALKWRQTHQVLLTYKFDTKNLIALLDKELLQVENLVAESRAKNKPVVAEPMADKGSKGPIPVHSPDFRSVNWYGVDYEFTPNQAACVKVLWEAFEVGIGSMGELEILDRAGLYTGRLYNVFRNKIKGTCRVEPHNALNHMIVKGGTSGTYRLNAAPKLPRK